MNDININQIIEKLNEKFTPPLSPLTKGGNPNTPLCKGGKGCYQNFIHITPLHTPIGTLIAAATDKGICMLEFDDYKSLELELWQLIKTFETRFTFTENDHIKSIITQLDEYFKGIRKHFDVKLDLVGTEFQKQVWLSLLSIPYGSIKSYKQQAEYLNKPKSVRAVANANGNNKISIIIPCHRVIGSDGSLTGYGGGLERKKWLLEHEKNIN